VLSKDVRQSFLDFFRSKGHQIFPSAPVIPAQDPTLLFTNAGMNQFKDVFLGDSEREFKRVANSQKCIRVSGKHNDLEEVGVDVYHHTFFEMLGNWSFGDYYKKEAILWAWELFTEIWKLDKNRIYATVYEDDDDAEKLWYEVTDILPGRVGKLGKEENFWEMGETGPCGPCSEIHYDLGEKYACGPECSMGCECGRFVELWNLVFIQFNREQDGSLNDLPQKHVDTGMGFERITAALQGKRSNYDTDLFTGIMDTIRNITGVEYEEDNYVGVAFRVIADHIRALTFAIADGALPSNEGRGYVLRRILRRAARYSRNLNIREPFMYKLVTPVVDVMGSVYPESLERANYIAMVIKSEEEGFGKTLDRGIEIFNKIAGSLHDSGTKVISGQDAFKLYDTYGFPLDLTQLMARERNLSVDLAEFDKEMTAQKERSYSKKYVHTIVSLKKSTVKTKFTYQKETITTEIAAIYDEDGNPVSEAETGQQIQIQLAGETPFYAEAGGQVGDAGTIETADGKTVAEVIDTQKMSDTTIFHYGSVTRGTIKVKDKVTVTIDSQRRLDIKRNHTATHLLHKALQGVLGSHIKQAGSLVAPTHLRFDFNHFHKMTHEEIVEVESRVNDAVRKNYPVVPEENVPFEEAKKKGAMALFGEKYGDRVRTVTIKNYSIELCGGTHIEYTGLIGEFRIVSESAAAAGVRRIVAETGRYSHKRTQIEREQLAQIKELLNAQVANLIDKVDQTLLEKKELEKALKDERQKSTYGKLVQLIEGAKDAGEPPLVTQIFSVNSIDELKEFGDVIRSIMPDGAALLGARIDNKALLVCVVGDNLIKDRMWDAAKIIEELSRTVGGGGGGKRHMATAGIKDANKLNDAIKKFPEITELLYGSVKVNN